MGIMDDVQRLGIELSKEDKNEIEAIYDRARTQKEDELVRRTFVEYYIGEYFTIMRPEIMSALEADKTEQNKKLIEELGKRFDERGKRICDEVGCSLTENVDKCEFCERYVCAKHNYGKGGHCCYACYLENGGQPITHES